MEVASDRTGGRMSERKPPAPPTDDKVISLADIRKRVEVEAKKTGGTPADIFKELFGSAFGFPGTPYDETLRRQKAEAETKRQAAEIQEMVKREVIEPLKAQIERAIANTERALTAAERWKAEAEKLQDENDELRDKFHELKRDGVEVDLGYVIDSVIDTLRRDPRMPKLSRFEWEKLLGDHYGTDTIDVADELGDIDLERELQAMGTE
jgi:hypothetical protein